MITVEDLELPTFLKERLTDAEVRGRFKEAFGDSGKNWVNGSATPRDDVLSQMRETLGLAPVNGEGDALAQAIAHDRSLRRRNDIHYDPEGKRAFGEAFTKLTDDLQVQQDMPVYALIQQLGLNGPEYYTYRKGEQVPFFRHLRQIVYKSGFSPESPEVRPLLDAAFQARHLGVYEPLPEVLADMKNIQHRGTLLSRLRLANLMEISEVAQQVGGDERSIGNYEQGVSRYHRQREKLAQVLVPLPPKDTSWRPGEGNHRDGFLKAVQRLHAMETPKEVLRRAASYDSARDLLADLLEVRGLTHEALIRGSGYNMDKRDTPPNEHETWRIVLMLDLSKLEGVALAGHMKLLREAWEEQCAQRQVKERQEKEPDRAAMEAIIMKVAQQPDTYDSFGACAMAIREAAHLTQEELGEKYGCSKAYVSELEHGAHFTRKALHRWAAALGLENPQIDMLASFNETKRAPRRKYTRKKIGVESNQPLDIYPLPSVPVTEQQLRGDFGLLLKAYLETHDDPRDPQRITSNQLAEKAGIGLSTLVGILSGRNPRPQMATVERITTALGFASMEDFFRLARPVEGREKLSIGRAV